MKTVYILHRSRIADGWSMVFAALSMAAAYSHKLSPPRLRSGIASICWESLVSIHHCLWEEFINSRFVLLFMDIDLHRGS